jgi:acylphosphatase
MRRRYVVRGTVQGVNFRNNAVAEASRLGVTGRVWNHTNGSVGCVAEGDAAALDRFGQWLARGPRGARVKGVEAFDLSGDPRYGDFQISWEAVDERS